MIKKLVIGAVVLIFLIAISFGALRLFADHSKVADGRYQIQNNVVYPDAYILVEDGQAQFFHIDLNELYKESIVEDYLNYLKNYKKQELTASEEKQVRDAIDLNAQFCETKFVLDYSEENYNFCDEEGLYHYNFGFITEGSYLSYEYDWENRSITLNHEEAGRIEFKR